MHAGRAAVAGPMPHAFFPHVLSVRAGCMSLHLYRMARMAGSREFGRAAAYGLRGLRYCACPLTGKRFSVVRTTASGFERGIQDWKARSDLLRAPMGHAGRHVVISMTW